MTHEEVILDLEKQAKVPPENSSDWRVLDNAVESIRALIVRCEGLDAQNILLKDDNDMLRAGLKAHGEEAAKAVKAKPKAKPGKKKKGPK